MSIALLGSLWRPGLPPGVYEERPLQGARTRVRLDVAAFVGLAERGPINTPVAIDDVGQFAVVFGRALPGLALPLAVRLFFANGGRRCLAVRCVDHPDVRTTRLLLPCSPLRIGLEVIRLMRSDNLAAVKQPSLQSRPARLERILEARRLFLGFGLAHARPPTPPIRPCFRASIT